MRRILLLAATTCIVTNSPVIHSAEPPDRGYRLDWFTADGGGGGSRGGTFTLIGTIGQPDAGGLAAGTFKQEGGFWSGVTLLQTSGGPVLKIRLTDPGHAVISWPADAVGFELEECSALSGGLWAPVSATAVQTGGEQTVTVPASGMKWYRLKKSLPNP